MPSLFKEDEMSKKDRIRAKEFVHRNGQKIPRHLWDKHQRELREASEAQRLASIGLVRGQDRILTPEEVWAQRRPVKRGE